MILTLKDRVVPYTRMTQRSKFSARAQTYLASKEHLGYQMRSLAGQVCELPIFPKPVRVRFEVVFYGDYAGCDLDNLAKAVADAANGILWDDDEQMDSISATRVKDDGYRTEVVVELLCPR